MHGAGDAGDPAAAGALEVVGIDVQADHALALGYCKCCPAIAAILVVPMSRPTIIGASFTFIDIVFCCLRVRILCVRFAGSR